MKKLLSLVVSLMLAIGMVGCSSKDKPYTTQYLTEQGKQSVENFKEDKSEYRELTELDDYTEKGLVKLTIVVKDIDIDKKNVEIDIDYDKTDIDWNTQNFVRVIFPSFTVNQEFKRGDTITIYGRYNGITSKTFDLGEKDKSTHYFHHITGHFIELGEGTKDSDKEESKFEDKEEVTKENNDNTTKETISQSESTNNLNGNSSNKQTNNSNSNTNNNSTCDFCGSATNTVQTYGNYRLCHSCYQGVVNSAEGDHKLYEEDCNNNYQSDQDYEKDVEYHEDGGVKDGTTLGEQPWNQDDYNEEDDD